MSTSDAGAAVDTEDSLKVLTYNVGCGEEERVNRFHTLLDIIFAEMPDLVALQEVCAETAELVAADSRVRSYYYITDPEVRLRVSVQRHIFLCTSST